MPPEFLTAKQMAELLRISKAALLAKSKGKRARIPAIWLNQRLVRYHLPTVISKMAADSGLSYEIIRGALLAEEGAR